MAIGEKEGERTPDSLSAIEGSERLPEMAEGKTQFFDEVLDFDSNCKKTQRKY